MTNQRAGAPPDPTPIYRIVHIDNLPTIIARGALHAPSSVPNDGLPWISIHATSVQADRGQSVVRCGPRGRIRDYVGFYFGPRSPMLYRVHTGFNVARTDQSSIIYLVSSVQAVAARSLGFVFTDRHSLARVASFYDDLSELSEVDFTTCNARQWNSTADHPDRQEKKQAEFLVHRVMPWDLIDRIGVLNSAVRQRVESILGSHDHPEVAVKQAWYY
jgi:hypothetical protein